LQVQVLSDSVVFSALAFMKHFRILSLNLLFC
jgi:hypothetical protein